MNLSENELCGLSIFGHGTYNVDGITAIADALRVTASLTSLNLASNNIAGETGYVKVSEVQGSSFEKGDTVVYKGQEMIISQGKDSDGDIKMIDMSGIKAIADALRVSASLTSVR